MEEKGRLVVLANEAMTEGEGDGGVARLRLAQVFRAKAVVAVVLRGEFCICHCVPACWANAAAADGRMVLAVQARRGNSVRAAVSATIMGAFMVFGAAKWEWRR